MPLMKPPKYPVQINGEEFASGLVFVQPGHVAAMEAVGWELAGDVTTEAPMAFVDEGEDDGQSS